MSLRWWTVGVRKQPLDGGICGSTITISRRDANHRGLSGDWGPAGSDYLRRGKALGTLGWAKQIVRFLWIAFRSRRLRIESIARMYLLSPASFSVARGLTRYGYVDPRI